MNTTRSVPLFPEFRRGMGFGGWLTNYKRFNVLPQAWRTRLTVGDFEHFRTYLTEADAENVAAMGFDHVRVGFDQRVLEERPGVFREEILGLLDRFCGWFESRGRSLFVQNWSVLQKPSAAARRTQPVGSSVPGSQ